MQRISELVGLRSSKCLRVARLLKRFRCRTHCNAIELTTACVRSITFEPGLERPCANNKSYCIFLCLKIIFFRWKPNSHFGHRQKNWRCCDRKSRAACAQSFAPWQQATIEINRRDHSIIACSRHIHNGVILHAHPVRGESHNQRNTTGEVATTNIKHYDMRFRLPQSLPFPQYTDWNQLQHKKSASNSSLDRSRKVTWNCAIFSPMPVSSLTSTFNVGLSNSGEWSLISLRVMFTVARTFSLPLPSSVATICNHIRFTGRIQSNEKQTETWIRAN